MTIKLMNNLNQSRRKCTLHTQPGLAMPNTYIFDRINAVYCLIPLRISIWT